MFGWDGDDVVTFAGWHEPSERWNGWACPFFDLETVRAIADATTALDGRETVLIREDGSVWLSTSSEDEPYQVETRRLADGETVFGVGAGAWVWDDVSQIMPDLGDPDEMRVIN